MADNALEDIAVTLAKCHYFVDSTFTMGVGEGKEGVMSPPRKAALATWKLYYHSIVNVPGCIIQRLLPLVCQCEAVDADTLKMFMLLLVHQANMLKHKFNVS